MGCNASRQEISSSIQGKMPEANYNIEEHPSFYVVQLFTGCLAEMAYYIESEKEAVIIDPLREIQPYLEIAQKRGAKIKYILETHFHADFVSGHFDLAKKTGAKIVFGPTAQPNFEIHQGTDGEKLNIIHTPGHTQESTSYLLLDGERQHAVFTGDTLFLGEVGRPDLAVKSGEITKEDLAGWMYDSLRNKIMKLDPKTIVYPGHGAGSSCGKKIQQGSFDTLENQMKTNYALQEMTREKFVEQLTTDLPKPPQYFFHDVMYNKSGPSPVDDILTKNLVFIKADKFLSEVQKVPNAVILDTRPAKVFQEGFVPSSINISLTMNYAVMVGTLFDPSTKFFIVSESGKERESIIRLARIGYDNVLGCLEGGYEGFKQVNKTSDTINHISAERLTKDMHFVDVRNGPELASGHLSNCHHIPLGELETRLKNNSNPEAFPKDIPIYIHCKVGGRSMVACSILKKYGYTNQINIDGGFDEIKKNTDLEYKNM